MYDGKDFVAICRLRPLRPLTIVDLTKVPLLSPYDPKPTLQEFHRAAFLNQFELRLDQRRVWNRKRQARDNHIRERFARDIDAAPKAIRPEKHAPRGGLELLE